MRRIIPVLLCLFLLVPCATAEDTLFAWSLSIGGDGVTTPVDMAVASEGGVFIVGHTTSEGGDLGEGYGNKDGFVLRLSANGTVLWQRRLGGTEDDTFTSVVETPDGGCLALGSTLSTDGDARASRGGMDAWIVRLDAEGETVWTKSLGGSLDDELLVLQITEEGTYFACGRTMSRNGDLGANFGGWDAWATMLSAEDGKPLWNYRYGFSGDDVFLAAHPAANGWLLLGEIAEESGQDEDGNPLYTSRPIAQMLSFTGEPSWEEPVLLGDTGVNKLTSILEIESGWLLAGTTNTRSSLMPSTHGGVDIWMLHLRQNGTVAWQRSYGGRLNESFHSMQKLPSGGYLLLGGTNSTDSQVYGAHGGEDVWLVHISASAVQRWQQPIGGTEDSWPAGLLQREDGSLLVAGTTVSQDGDIGRHISVRTGFLSLLGPNGNLQSTQVTSGTEEMTLLQIKADDGIAYLLGSVRSINADGPTESIWIGRLLMEGFLGE